MTTFHQEQTKSCNLNIHKEIGHDFLKKIRLSLRQYSFFNLFFILIGALELLLCLVFFNLLIHSHLLAITLAIFLMTLFSYFILKTYFQNKKPQTLLKLCEESYEKLSDEALRMQNPFESKLFLASSLMRLASMLKDQEYHFYKPHKNFDSLRLSFEKLGCWLHWKDFHMVKEWLFFQTIDQYISLIKEQPDHLQLHVALANTYVMFSRIYSVPNLKDHDEDQRWLPAEKFSEKMKANFKNCAERAIEEFKILNDYNPEDPWVYTQLAYSYHDLKMPQEEIKAYETIARLVPADFDNLYKLGTLYFQEGLTAKGLKIYEELKKVYPSKAESLIKYYGYYSDSHLFSD